MSASVVSSSDAMDEAFCNALRTILAGPISRRVMHTAYPCALKKSVPFGTRHVSTGRFIGVDVHTRRRWV
jgi:hypothetical protein